MLQSPAKFSVKWFEEGESIREHEKATQARLYFKLKKILGIKISDLELEDIIFYKNKSLPEHKGRKDDSEVMVSLLENYPTREKLAKALQIDLLKYPVAPVQEKGGTR